MKSTPENKNEHKAEVKAERKGLALRPMYSRPDSLSIDNLEVKIDKESLMLWKTSPLGMRFAIVGWWGKKDRTGKSELIIRFKVGLDPNFESIKYKEVLAQIKNEYGENNVVVAVLNAPGQVHIQAVELVERAEPELKSSDYFRIGFSATKNDWGFYPTNRSSLNRWVYDIDPLAKAYFSLDDLSNNAYELWYNLERSIECSDFSIICHEIAKILSGTDKDFSMPIDELLNFNPEEQWKNFLKAEFLDDAQQKKIQCKLQYMLALYLCGFTVNTENDPAETEQILLNGFEAASKNHGITFNFNSLEYSALFKQKEKTEELIYLQPYLLVIAICYQRPVWVEFLLKSGASTDVVINKSNQTPIFLAIEKNDIDLIHMLLKHSPKNINDQDADGATPLHNAIMRYHSDKSYLAAILVLLENKPNLNLKNNDGLTALDLARSFQQNDVIELLLKQSPSLRFSFSLFAPYCEFEEINSLLRSLPSGLVGVKHEFNKNQHESLGFVFDSKSKNFPAEFKKFVKAIGKEKIIEPIEKNTINIQPQYIPKILDQLGIGENSFVFEEKQKDSVQHYVKTRLKEGEWNVIPYIGHSKSKKLAACLLFLAELDIPASLQDALKSGSLGEMLAHKNKLKPG